jgi:hypothetical protein
MPGQTNHKSEVELVLKAELIGLLLDFDRRGSWVYIDIEINGPRNKIW